MKKKIFLFVLIVALLALSLSAYAIGDYSGNLTGATWYWPLSGYTSTSAAYGKISSSYGYRGKDGSTVYNRNHYGVDISIGKGTSVYAVREGTVITAVTSNSSSAGRHIVIDHGDGYFSVYMHLNEVLVSVGTKVSLSTVIGKSGASGNGSDNGYGAHLHLGIHYGSSYSSNCNVNPCPSGYTRIGNSFQEANGGHPEGTASIAYQLDRNSAAISGKYGDNLTWTLDQSTGKLTISGSGEMWDYTSSAYIPWCDYRSSIKTVSIDNAVTSIGDYAFCKCDSLTSITIPDSVTSIGEDAFFGCGSLTSISIPDSVTSIGEAAFFGCERLTSITIPSSVTSIGSLAFSVCDSLTSITIPNSVTSIEYEVFYGCSSLTSISIPDSVTSIGEAAFCGCERLTSITIPDSVTNIENSAFLGTAYYNDVSNWENDVLYIGKHLIKAKDTISGSYKIKPGTLTIARSAFSCCDSLESITIPASVENIGDYVFYECTKLSDVYYSGAKSDWDKITIGTDNSSLTSARLHTVEPKTLSSISVKTKPTKLEYTIGESLNTAGLTLTATYSDNSTEIVTSGFTCTGFSSTTAGTKTVTVTYEGKTATFTVTVKANAPAIGESDAAVYAPSIKALKGKTVSLDILIQNNPGINTVGVEVSFDKNVFTLKEMTPGAVFDPTTADGNIAKNPFVFSAYDAKGDKTENGALFTLTFEVADGCADGDYTIGVNVIEAFNNAEKTVSFKSGSGKITVLSVEPGDVNGDGAVNRLDLTRLAKYFAGYEVEIVEAAADVTGDSTVNRLDLTRLAKYFAGYDVKLGE